MTFVLLRVFFNILLQFRCPYYHTSLFVAKLITFKSLMRGILSIRFWQCLGSEL